MPYSPSRHSIPYPGKRRRSLGVTPGCSKHHGPSWLVFIVNQTQSRITWEGRTAINNPDQIGL